MAGDTDMLSDRSDKLCAICSSSIRKSGVKCANDKCDVVIHTKYFEAVARVFLADRWEWQCKSCLLNNDGHSKSDNLPDLKQKLIFLAYIKRETKNLNDLIEELKLNNNLLKDKINSFEKHAAPMSNFFAPSTNSSAFYSDVAKNQ
ncbi:unnamed protein product [Psylliodes chrysocephalus]|uniref:Uncharacterized protein n=1 Tax=Psylliodes chrysocephalus TaxID=3402493 RepID=A0A9P0GGG9_9CUCU|nr:unnamed protein product [Psylliodes chrysocephala]